MITLAPPVQDLVSYTKAELVVREADIVSELRSLLDDYYRMQADATRSYSEYWIASQGESVAQRDRDAKLASYNTDASVLETRGQIEALKVEQNFIHLLLEQKYGASTI